VDNRMVVAGSVSRFRESWASALVKALHVETPEQLVPQILEKG
jgi:hypothetical protein